MAGAGAPDHIVHVQSPALTSVERIDARLKVGAQRAKPQCVLQKLTPDLLLIGFWQRLNLIQGFLKDLNHCRSLSRLRSEVKRAAIRNPRNGASLLTETPRAA
jgi:hypothetical protein